MQRRTSMATTWASSNPHSPELLVFHPARWTSPGTSRDLTPQYKYVFVGPKVLCFCKARHCSRRGELTANVRRTCEVCIRLREIKIRALLTGASIHACIPDGCSMIGGWEAGLTIGIDSKNVRP